MKITMNKIIMLFQAICLLGGNIVVAMEQDEPQKRGRSLNRSSTESKKRRNASFSRHHVGNLEASPKAKRARSMAPHANVSSIIIDSNTDISLDEVNQMINKIESDLNKTKDSLLINNKELNRIKQNIENKKKIVKVTIKDTPQYITLVNELAKLEPTKQEIETTITNLNSLERELRNYLFELKKTKKALEQKDAEYKAWLNEQKEDFIGLGKYVAGKAVGVGKGTADLAKQVAGKTIDAASYVYNSSLINNPLVNTISALGKTVYNTVTGATQQLETNIHQSLDLFGFNVEQNIIKPCVQAQERYDVIISSSDDLGKFVLDNSDISAVLSSEDEKIRAIQAVVEQLVEQYAITPSEITSDGIKLVISSLFREYRPIKQLLEQALSTSLTVDCSLIDALKNLKPEHKTVEKVQEKIKNCTQVLEERFAQWKEQEQAKVLASVTNESDKKAAAVKLQEKCQLYDAILTTLKDAMITYGCVFLIQTNLASLAAVDTKIIDKATVVYQKYVDTLSEYKKAKNKLDEDEAASLVKEHVSDGNVKKNADLIIKMKSLYKKDTGLKFSRKKRSQLIERDLGEVCSLVKNYIDKTSVLLAGVQSMTMLGYTGSSSIEGHLKPYETMFNSYRNQLTNAQQAQIDTILNDMHDNFDVLNAMKHQSLIYSDQATISGIKKLYKKLAQDKKTYKSAPISETVQDISLEMLTTNRSEGIAELLKTHKSVSKMITWAEKQQVAYGTRQAKRNAILHKIYDNAYSATKIGDAIVTLTNSLINNDVAVTDEDVQKFDDILASFMEYVEHESIRFTTEHRAFIENLAQEAVEDAKQNIKVQIVAGWTVLGVKAKMAFESLANTEGSSAKAVAKRALGNVLNAGRKGLVATGKAIAAENYHQETRQEIAEGTKAVAKEFGKGFVKGVKKTAKFAKQGINLLDDAINEYQDEHHKVTKRSKMAKRKSPKNRQEKRFERSFDEELVIIEDKNDIYKTDNNKNDSEDFR